MNVESHAKDENDDSTARLDVVEALSRGMARAVAGGQRHQRIGFARRRCATAGFLQCRRLVGVRGAGPAYDGEYVVKSVSTTLKPGEAKQRFTLGRNAHVSLSGRVTP